MSICCYRLGIISEGWGTRIVLYLVLCLGTGCSLFHMRVCCTDFKHGDLGRFDKFEDLVHALVAVSTVAYTNSIVSNIYLGPIIEC